MTTFIFNNVASFTVCVQEAITRYVFRYVGMYCTSPNNVALALLCSSAAEKELHSRPACENPVKLLIYLVYCTFKYKINYY